MRRWPLASETGQIWATHREIDALMCEVYGLTDDEIAVVEEAVQEEAAKRLAMEAEVQGPETPKLPSM